MISEEILQKMIFKIIILDVMIGFYIFKIKLKNIKREMECV